MAGVQIGWLGLGRMGLPMAKRLISAGYAVTGFDLSEEARAAFAAAGGRAVTRAADIARSAHMVITMLPTGAIVRAAILEGTDPVAAAMSAGSLLIDMSSSQPVLTREVGAALASMGISMIDAPVSGGVRKAIDGSLAIMVGGDAVDTQRADAVLRVMGATLFPTGPLGTAHAMKALNNYVSAAGLIAGCEAIRIGKAFGLDAENMVDILNASTGRNNSTENKLKQQVISGEFASGFGLALMTKDVRIAADLAHSLAVDAPMSQTVADFAAEALEALGPDSDHTEIDRHRSG